MKKPKNQRGFTLIEVLVVVIITGVLVAVAAPIYGEARQQAKEVAFDATVRSLRQAAMLYLLDDGEDAIWAPGAGQAARARITGSNEGWYEYLTEWPENPLGTGDFMVRIEGGEIFVSPGREGS